MLWQQQRSPIEVVKAEALAPFGKVFLIELERVASVFGPNPQIMIARHQRLAAGEAVEKRQALIEVGAGAEVAAEE